MLLSIISLSETASTIQKGHYTMWGFLNFLNLMVAESGDIMQEISQQDSLEQIHDGKKSSFISLFEQAY